jgi:hypothetical protein
LDETTTTTKERINMTCVPLQLDIEAIDLALIEDDNRDEFVVMRLIDATGLRLDVPMARKQAEAFGESLRSYASAEHVPAWL